MRRIAGHEMVDTPAGFACSICGRTWLEMLNAREHWRPGEMGIAHHGALNAEEVAELTAEVDRIWKALAA